jgi:hypothetical protein
MTFFVIPDKKCQYKKRTECADSNASIEGRSRNSVSALDDEKVSK